MAMSALIQNALRAIRAGTLRGPLGAEFAALSQSDPEAFWRLELMRQYAAAAAVAASRGDRAGVLQASAMEAYYERLLDGATKTAARRFLSLARKVPTMDTDEAERSLRREFARAGEIAPRVAPRVRVAERRSTVTEPAPPRPTTAQATQSAQGPGRVRAVLESGVDAQKSRIEAELERGRRAIDRFAEAVRFEVIVPGRYPRGPSLQEVLGWLADDGRNFTEDTPDLRVYVRRRLREELAGLRTYLPLRRAQSIVEDAVLEWVRSRFEEQGKDVHLAPLSPRYLEQKRRGGYDTRIGIRTGRLLDAIRTKARVRVRAEVVN